jgi:hypothetical protein
LKKRRGRKKNENAKKSRKAKENRRELQITLLWKPHMGNVAFFREAGRE